MKKKHLYQAQRHSEEGQKDQTALTIYGILIIIISTAITYLLMDLFDKVLLGKFWFGSLFVGGILILIGKGVKVKKSSEAENFIEYKKRKTKEWQ